MPETFFGAESLANAGFFDVSYVRAVFFFLYIPKRPVHPKEKKPNQTNPNRNQTKPTIENTVMNVQQLDRKLKAAGVTSYFFHNEGIIYYLNGKSNWEVTTASQTKLEHLESIALYLSRKVEAYGVKGMKSTPWRKTFKNTDALNAWVDKNSAEVHAVSFIS